MGAALALQFAVSGLLALIAAAGWSAQHGVHLALGGLAVALPNALFALRLMLQRGGDRDGDVAVFFVGEFAKIGLTVGLLVLTVRYVPDLQWLAWLVGVVASIKAPLLLGLRSG